MNDLIVIDQTVLKTASLRAKESARGRAMVTLHSGNSDPLQRMLNAVEPASYIRPHRHINPCKVEPVILLRGSIGFMVFADDGTPQPETFVLLHPTLGASLLDYRGSNWHTFFALEPDTIVFEVKAGPYDAATDKEFAAWAPPENSPEAAAYLQSIEKTFREGFREILPPLS